MAPRRPTPLSPRRRVRARQAYVMLVALLIIAILAVIGSSTLQVAGVDQRIAVQNRKHEMILNTASAGGEHARYALEHKDPSNEGIDTGDTSGDFVTATDAESNFGGLSYAHNLGVYWVEATYHRCGNPPPGYSTELGNDKFRSDYWDMKSTARMQDTTYTNINETKAETRTLLRKVHLGSCRMR